MQAQPIYTKLNWEHTHSKQLCYPTTTAAALALNIPTGAVSDTYGAWTLVIPASTYSLPFDIHFITVLDLPNVDNYIFQIGVGASQELSATIPVEKAAAQAANTSIPIITAKTDASWLGEHGRISPSDAVYVRVLRNGAGAVNTHIYLISHEY